MHAHGEKSSLKEEHKLMIPSSSLMHVIHLDRQKTLIKEEQNKLMPRIINYASSGAAGGINAKIETFSTYVARQMGFVDRDECPQLCKLADNYLKNSKETRIASIYKYFDMLKKSKKTYLSLYAEQLNEELDRCRLAYFAYNWAQAPDIITQVFSESKSRKFKDWCSLKLRKAGFEKVRKYISRMFGIRVEGIKPILKSKSTTNLLAPGKRNPVVLFVGGGMGANKNKILDKINTSDDCPFETCGDEHALVVDIDVFKKTYQAFNEQGHGIISTYELVHPTMSTDVTTLDILVSALNEGRDVIVDGTLSWEPFFEQTVAMIRNIHECRYRVGLGYKVKKDGTIIHKFWEKVEKKEPMRKPYTINLIGVISDPYLAVVRCIRRSIYTRKAITVKSELNSHKRFASAFVGYCDLVDHSQLHTTYYSPKMITYQEEVIDSSQVRTNWLNLVASINDDADSIDQLFLDPTMSLYKPSSPLSKNAGVLHPIPHGIQLHLKFMILKIEKLHSRSLFARICRLFLYENGGK